MLGFVESLGCDEMLGFAESLGCDDMLGFVESLGCDEMVGGMLGFADGALRVYVQVPPPIVGSVFGLLLSQ